jgi:hypothetical protein
MALEPVVGAGYIAAVNSIAEQVNAGEGSGFTEMPYQAPAAAADVAALKTQFDALLSKLVAAGLMASS